MTLYPIECCIEMLPWRLVVKLLTSPMFLLLGKWLQCYAHSFELEVSVFVLPSTVVTLIVLRTAGAGVFAFYGQYLFTEVSCK